MHQNAYFDFFKNPLIFNFESFTRFSNPLAPQCSVPCGIGQLSREVVCVSNQGDVERDEESNMKLKPDALQNCDMGACARS